MPILNVNKQTPTTSESTSKFTIPEKQRGQTQHSTTQSIQGEIHGPPGNQPRGNVRCFEKSEHILPRCGTRHIPPLRYTSQNSLLTNWELNEPTI